MGVERLAGMEVEYGFAVLSREGSRAPREPLVPLLMNEARKLLTALPGCPDGGLFLANGGRLYVDTGNHVEWCTPETGDPEEVVRYVKAGDRALAELARRVQARQPATELKLFRCNVDYAGSRATWGHHESYLHRAHPTSLHALLLPHLVTRIIYCGSGGLNPLSRGIEFSLSPRSAHLNTTRSGDSTRERGILHSRQEALCGLGWSRLHLICGDGLCSAAGLWLQVATTALVVALIEADRAPTRLQFLDPVGALRTFARDTRLTERAGLVAGRSATALDTQRTYLAAVEAARDHPAMPAWTAAACARWRETLDALEAVPDDPAGGLDWRLKRVLYRRVCRDSGVPGREVRFWNGLLERHGDALAGAVAPGERGALRAAHFERSLLNGALDRAFPEVRAAGRRWEGLADVLRLRARLCELELRWGEIGGNGLFDTLARAGALPAQALDPPGVAAALDTPPARGRAHVRGEAIRRLAREGAEAFAGWDAIHDLAHDRRLDLTDPFATQEAWIAADPGAAPDLGSLRRLFLARHLGLSSPPFETF